MNRFRIRNRHLLFLDALLLAMSAPLAYALRFEGWEWITSEHGQAARLYMLLGIPLRLACYTAVGLYRRLWRHASIAEVELLALAALTGGASAFLLGVVLLPLSGLAPFRVPLSVVGLDALFGAVALAAPRLLTRVIGWKAGRRRGRAGRRALIVGAGAAGQMTARELFHNPQLGIEPVGFVDDDTRKQGLLLHELPVLGGVADIPEIVQIQRVEQVIIAMPSAPGTVIRQIVKAALESGVETRTVPALSDIILGRVAVTSLRDIEIQDLLRREPVRTNLDEVRSIVAGRTVLVTGAGGSIGSEICRQVARHGPARLVLLGHGENSIFEIRQELGTLFPALEPSTVIADVRDRDRIARILAELRPDTIFHAAAHKHVPLMECNVVEAVTNNVLGTRNVVEAAAAAGTAHFVLISTDKAVRPTSVMGATKRVAEQVVQLTALRARRHYVAVRFGNVLGSRGSVVPTFLRQIRAGGPVTVTHPDMTRYFMTIPEAVELVLQAGSLGSWGEVFLLDMGEPVRIVDLATDLIRLSGLEVGRDIEIEFSGIRPGEKLFEEMVFDAEEVSTTQHPKVLRVKSANLEDGVERKVEALIAEALGGADESKLRGLLRDLVPDYAVPGGETREERPAPQRVAAASRPAAAAAIAD